MSAAEISSHNLSQGGQNLVRVLIASYFLAVPLGLIAGTGAGPLAAALLPAPYAEPAGRVIVFVTAYLVLAGIWLRAAALLLATLVFWSSYIGNAQSGDFAAFWRDLALIGGLILTYTQTLPRAGRRRAMLRWTPTARRVAPAPPVTPRRVVTLVRPSRSSARPALPAVEAPTPAAAPVLRLAAVRAEDQPDENIFREDPDLALAI